MEAVRRRAGMTRLAMYEVGMPVQPNRLLDITDLIETKKKAMECFVSQLEVHAYDQFIAGLNTYRAYTLPNHVKAAEAYLVFSGAELAADPLKLYESEYVHQKKMGYGVVPTEAKLVTVIVRTIWRNTIVQTLDSIALQTYPNVEVVVVDAAGSGEKGLGDWCGRFPMRICGTGKPLNRGAAANAGIRSARGHYLAFVDDDDMVDPDHIERLVQGLEKSGCDVAYCGARVLDERGVIAKIPFSFNEEYDPDRLLVANYMPNNTVLVSRRIVDQGCWFDEDLNVYEDWDFLIQLSTITRFQHVPNVSAVYRITDSSGIGVHPKSLLDQRAHLLPIYGKWRQRWTNDQLLSIMDLANSGALLPRLRQERNDIAQQLQETASQLNATQQQLQATTTQLNAMQQQLQATTSQLRSSEAILERIRRTLPIRVYLALKVVIADVRRMLSGILQIR